MRSWRRESPDDTRERCLGELAPYYDAARSMDGLGDGVDTRRIRKHIMRTLFRTRFLGLRARLVPVLASLGLLVVGGAAFATAQSLGILPGLGQKSASVRGGEPVLDVRKHKAPHGKAAGRTPRREGDSVAGDDASDFAAVEALPVFLPDVPDPLIVPISDASTSVWALLSDSSKPDAPGLSWQSTARGTTAAGVANSAKPRPRRLALLTSAETVGTGISAPTPDHPAPSAPAQPSLVTAPTVAPLAGVQVTFAPSPPAPQPPAIAPVVAKMVEPPSQPTLSDQALFLQAMRRMRSLGDASGALALLQEHARFYPRSGLAGERKELEVEALLALHRNGEALATLDSMSVEDLPRAGERLVVRGELRAAAKRWLDASTDFDQALSMVSGSPAWHERALWGRAAARLRCGERESGLADMERYLDVYPRGRFAVEAAKFFPNK